MNAKHVNIGKASINIENNMGKILDWFIEMEKANPSFITNVNPNPPKIINNYYITNDNRVIKITQEEFNKITKNKQIVDTTCKKLLE